jgi:hypothetical protein
MQALALRRQWMGHCELHVSYIEVFGEEVSDLLAAERGHTVGAWRGSASSPSHAITPLPAGSPHHNPAPD